MTIASLTGVARSDAGIASGLINTSRQIGGAIGLAGASAIAATSTHGYADSHAAIAAVDPAGLDHGYQTALYVLMGLLVVGALLAFTFTGSEPTPEARPEPIDADAIPVEEAA